MAAKLVDYQFGGIAAGLIPDPDRLTGFFGFWLSTFSVISFILQLFFTRKIIERFGVTSTLIFLPGTISLAVIILFLFPGILAAAVFAPGWVVLALGGAYLAYQTVYVEQDYFSYRRAQMTFAYQNTTPQVRQILHQGFIPLRIGRMI